jgi:hypothetical protein
VGTITGTRPLVASKGGSHTASGHGTDPRHADSRAGWEERGCQEILTTDYRQGILTLMNEDTMRYELSAEGQARIEAVDGYLERAIRDGRPIEALIATRQLGEITDLRAKEAARVATEGSWSWADVGGALGVTKQAAHEKLHARIQGKLDEARSKLQQAEQDGHGKIARRAERQHEKLSRDLQKAREQLARAEQKVQDTLDKKGSAA